MSFSEDAPSGSPFSDFAPTESPFSEDAPTNSPFQHLPPVLVQNIISHLQSHHPSIPRKWYLPSWPLPPNTYHDLEATFALEHAAPKPFFTTSVANLRQTCQALRAAAAPLTIHINLHAMYLGHQNWLDLPRLAETWPNVMHLRIATEYYEDKICCVEENDPEMLKVSSKPRVSYEEQVDVHHWQWDKFGGYCERVAAGLRYCWNLVQTAVVPVNADIVFSLVTNCNLLHSVGLSDAMVFDLMDRVSVMDVDWHHSLSPGEHLLPCLDLLATCTQLTRLELIQKYAELTQDELSVIGGMTQLRELSLELDAERMFWLRDGEFSDDAMNMDLTLVLSVMDTVGKLDQLSHLHLVMMNLHNANLDELHTTQPHSTPWSLSTLSHLKYARIHVEAKRCKSFWNPGVFQGCDQLEQLVLEPALKGPQAAMLVSGLHNLTHLDWAQVVHSNVQLLDDSLATQLAEDCPHLAVLKVGAVKLSAAFTGVMLDLRELHVSGTHGFSCEVLLKDFAPRLEVISAGTRPDVHRNLLPIIKGHPTVSTLQTLPFGLLLESCGLRRRPKVRGGISSCAVPISLSTSAGSSSSIASAVTPSVSNPLTHTVVCSPLTPIPPLVSPNPDVILPVHNATSPLTPTPRISSLSSVALLPSLSMDTVPHPASAGPLSPSHVNSSAGFTAAGYLPSILSPPTKVDPAPGLSHPVPLSTSALTLAPLSSQPSHASLSVPASGPSQSLPLTTASLSLTPLASLSSPPSTSAPPSGPTHTPTLSVDTDHLTLTPLVTLPSLTSLHLFNENYSSVPSEPISNSPHLPVEITKGWASTLHHLTLTGYQAYKNELGYLTSAHLKTLLHAMPQLRVLCINDHSLIPCTREAVAGALIDVAGCCLSKMQHLETVEVHTNMLRVYQGAVEVEEECVPFILTRFLLALASSGSIACVRLTGVDRKRAGMITQEVQVARDTHADLCGESLPFTVEVADGTPKEA